MLEATDTDFAPWYIVRSDDKKRARLNVLSHFLSLIPYEALKHDKIKLPTRSKENAYDDEATIKDRRWIEERF
jgi:polyphosphate kinase